MLKPLALALGAIFVFLQNCGKPHESGRERRCFIRFPMHEKRLLQPSHKYGLMPVCMEEWVTKLSRYENDLPQTYEIR